MTLAELAKKVSSTYDYVVADDTPCDVPDEYKGMMTGIINLFQSQAFRLGTLSFPFIETAFEGIEPDEVMEKKLGSDDIPDSLIQGVSMGIYDKLWTELDDDQRSIIKLLVAYIIISK